MPLNCYADLLSFKRRYVSLLDSVALDTVDASEIEKVIEAASRQVDGHTGRHFFAETATKYVSLDDGAHKLWLPDDLLAVTTLKTDDSGDRTFDTVWNASTDYYLGPEQGGYNGASLPKSYIDVDRINAAVSYFPRGRRSAEIVGRWGYTEQTENVVASNGTQIDITTTISSSATTTTVTDLSDIAVGQTLLLESEQVYVKAFNDASDLMTMVRGVNGTTAAGHNAGVDILRFVYHPLIREATLIQAGRIWERRKNAYATQVHMPAVGSFETIPSGLDPDVKQMLAPFVKRSFVFA